jgi:hypothetical protein
MTERTAARLLAHRGRGPFILLWGLPEEEPLAAVGHALHARGARTVMVDQRRALSTRMRQGPQGPVLRLPGADVPLGEVTAAYPRPYPWVPPQASRDRPGCLVARRHVARLEHELWQWTATTTATVVNRPAAAASNSAKPVQTRVARACGFAVPDTLLTNDLGQARAFAARHGRVVYKAAGGTRTYTRLLDLADARRLERLGTCPTYFQRYIAGTNVRVHVVGTDVFPVEIISDAVDYRNAAREMRPVVLPGPVAELCRSVTKALDLLVAGVDLIRTPDGEWYFLEANPSPAFTFYPDRDQVGVAIARLLMRPVDGSR